MKRFALLTAILLGLPAAAFGEQFAKVGTFGAQYLKIGVSARGTGMGSAFTAVADDANSVFWNPGGLVNVVTNEVALNHVEWPADIKLDQRRPRLQAAFDPRHAGHLRALAVARPDAGAHGLRAGRERPGLRRR